jgi:hypothetical protein
MTQNYDSDDVLLPPWADRLAHGDYRVVGAMLPTRDGRKMGNATLLLWTLSKSGDAAVATIRTDAGNEVRMTERELEDQFWPPTWLRKKDGVEGARDFIPYSEIAKNLVDNGGNQGQAIMSIAESLKRIADMGPALGEVGWHLKRIADVIDPVDKSRGDFFQQANEWFHTWLGVWRDR